MTGNMAGSRPASLIGLFAYLILMNNDCGAVLNVNQKHVFFYKTAIKKCSRNRLLPDDFWEMFKYDSKLFRYAKSPIRSLKFLDGRARQDIKMLKLRVQAYGFFTTNISYTVSVNQNKVIVVIFPDFGSVFKITNIKVKNLSDDAAVKTSDQLKPICGKPASYANIEAAAYIVEKTYGRYGYPFAKVIEKIEKIDRKNKTVTLYFSVAPGKFVVFGDTRIKTSNRLSHQFIKNRITWKNGEPYDVYKIEETTKKLLNTQIFSYVDIQNDMDKLNNYTSTTVNLINNKQRLLELGVSLSSSSIQRRSRGGLRVSSLDKSLKSVVAKASWTHFNIFGGGERLRTNFKITPASILDNNKGRNFESTADIELMKPDVLKTDNAVIYHFKISREPTYVYLKQGGLIEGLYEVPIANAMNVRAGLSIEYAQVESFNTSNPDYGLAKKTAYAIPGIPIYIIYNSYDRPLNPSKGLNINVLELPQYGRIRYVQNKSSQFCGLNYLEGKASVAQAVDKKKRFIVAGWTSLKQISGSAFAKLPLDKRLYAGGIGSVRGYADQMAGPIIENSTEPSGGRSTFGVGGELRLKLTDKIGVVSFLEGAKVSQSLWPVGGDRFYSGWGVGVRYYTSIGPVLIDFAFPCKKRDKIDSSTQFMISLGQAF
ncbi:MAG: BamA/TamA family outer membrane protein [Holosporales bacterium]|jgi:translocation and assembly module TamA|nr:BamA/TamA family outer membrane protein [Holosporales bacterium]